jgi:hypothetical protein
LARVFKADVPRHVRSTAGSLSFDNGRIGLPAWGFTWLTRH